MLDQRLAEAMQRVLSKEEERFTLTATLQRLVDDGIGTKRGKSVYFNSKDRDEMRKWLEAKGFSIEPVDLAGLNRGDCLALTPYEKAGNEPVKRHRISVKSLAGQALVLDGKPLVLPDTSHLDVDWTKIVSQIGHGCIMVVENYESFNRIHETNFKLPEGCSAPLVVYRGDPHESRTDNVLRFLTEAKLPVLAFVDADPAGIVIAANLPGVIGLVAPDLITLDEQLASPRIGRRDLFIDQYLGAKNALGGIGQGNPCWRVLDLILRHRSGVVQEHWIGRVVCTLVAL